MIQWRHIEHVLRAAAALTEHHRFVLIGTCAVIATSRKPVPAAMMLTSEVDLFADNSSNAEELSDLIDAAIGRDSLFHRTFHYFGDGVSATTAILPTNWRDRASNGPWTKAASRRSARAPMTSPWRSSARGGRRIAIG